MTKQRRHFILHSWLVLACIFMGFGNVFAANMLSNSDLESGNTWYWETSVSGSSFTIVSSPLSYAGSYSGGFCPMTTSGKSLRQTLTVVPGTTYYYAGFFQLANGESVDNFGLFVSTKSQSGGATDAYVTANGTVTTDAPSWMMLSRSTIAGPGFTLMCLHVRMRDGATAPLTTGYFDNIYFSADTPPDAISNLTALSGTTENSINLRWTSPGADGTDGPFINGAFILKYTSAAPIMNFDDPGLVQVTTVTISTSIFTPGTQQGYLVTGLLQGVSWYFAIETYDGLYSTSTWSQVANIFSSAAPTDFNPAAPSMVISTFTLITQSTLSFQWNASTSPDVASYYVYYGSTSGVYIDTVNVGNVIAYSLTGLTENVTYYIAIRTKDNAGNMSSYSSEFSTRCYVASPSAPTGFSSATLTTSSILWMWTPISNASTYYVYCATDTSAPNNGTSSISGAIAHPTTSYTQSSLSPNTSASMFVTAKNTAGESAASSSATVFTLANVPTSPAFTFVGISSVGIQWSTNSNPSYTTYEVSRSTDNFAVNFSTSISFSVNMVFTSTAVTGLVDSVTYYFRVRASNSDGRITDPATVITTCTKSSLANHLVISEIQINPSTAQFVEIYNPTSSDVSLNGWSLIRKTASGITVATLVTFTSAHTVTANGYFLAAADSYTGSVSGDATCDGFSTSSDSTIQLKNSAGSLIDIVGFGSITNTTDGYEGSPYSSRPSSGQSIERKAYAGSTASDMSSGGAHELLGNGSDTNNNANDFITRTTPDPQNTSSPAEPRAAVVPASISDLTALVTSNEGEVSLGWTAPGSDGTTGTVSGYLLKISTNGVIRTSLFNNTTFAYTWTQTNLWSSLLSGGNKESRVITGLLPGVQHYFALKAKGTGDYSSWSSSKDVDSVNVKASTIPLDFPPVAVTGFAVVSSNTVAQLSWSASTSTDLSYYRIFRELVSGATTEIKTTTATFYTVTGLTNGVRYYFRVKAVDAVPSLESAYSTEYSTIPNLPPPQSLSAADNDTSVDLTWTHSLDRYASNFRIYNLRRGVASGGPYTVLVGTFSSSVSTFTDTVGITPGVTYYYVIYSSGSATIPISVGNEVEGLPSVEAVALPDVAPPAISITTVTLLNFTGSVLSIAVSVEDYRDFAKTIAGEVQTVKLYYHVEKSTSSTTAIDYTVSQSSYLSKFSGSADISVDTLSLAVSMVSTITYFATAYDGTNISSSSVVTLIVTKPESQTVGSSGGTLTVSFPDGGQLVLEIPAGALDVPTVITINTFDDNNPAPQAASEPDIDLKLISNGKPLAAYEFGPEGTTFKISPTLKLYYQTPTTPIETSKLKVFLREGSKWKNQGGKANDQNQVVFKPKHFSKYAVFPAKASTQRTTDKKFITPNGDGKNDSAGWSELIKSVTICDVTGLEIWAGNVSEFAKDQLGEVIQWDGRDKNGVIVEGGAYIYKAESFNNDVTYGTIIVIR